MNIQDMGQKTLSVCRQRGWAALETGITRPVPVVVESNLQLSYLLYQSRIQPPYQLISEPFARVNIDYATGDIVEYHGLPVSDPPRILGRYPHAEAARIPHAEWQQIWNELFDLYPHMINAFAGRAAAGWREKAERFAQLFELTTPPFLMSAYRDMNPSFFDWLDQTRGGSTVR
jgi:hypothetical protein